MNRNLSQTIELQQLASNPNHSAWVFASAGSGKTKILTDRVLRLLLDDVRPDKILCLTFTKTAAAEMQERINLELAKWILCNEDELRQKLSDLSGKLPNQNEIKKAQTLFTKIIDEEFKIKVQTIHAFCQTLIKIFPFEAKTKPNFEILEENQENLLLKQAQKKVLEDAIHNKNLRYLVEEINSKLHEESFLELVFEIIGKKEKLIYLKDKFFGIDNLIAEIYKNFSISLNETSQNIFDKFLLEINQLEVLKLAQKLAESSSSKNKQTSQAIKDFLEKPILENFPIYQEAFFTKDFKIREIYGEAAKGEELLTIKLSQQILISEFLDKINSLKICNNTALLLKFTNQILENYSALKRQNSFLDYNDLITKTNQLLTNPDFSEWVKLKMDGTFDHILIDESQDTNHQQWNIIKALCDDFFSGLSANNQNRSIFIVGDEKQSIYSFQGAEPNISEEIFSYFQQKLGNKLKKIELNNSFRSLKSILQAVDRVFADDSRKNSISKISKFQEHRAIRNGDGKVEIWPQFENKKKEKEETSYEWKIDFSPQEHYKETDKLAEIIASKIRNLVENNYILETHERPVKYSDFMILLRKRTGDFNQSLVKFFHKYQIPFTTSGKISFSKNLLIQDLLAAAKFTLLESDNLNLCALLKSPIFAISEEDLFEICLFKNENNINVYKALSQFEKFKNIKNNLDELSKKSQELNVFEFFYYLIEGNNNRQKIIAFFGHESLEIIDKFILLTFDFCQNFSPNLQKFLEFIEKLDPTISISGNQDNNVKISTIHAAKGLQAPIVIMPDCCYNFNQLLAAKEKISWIEFDNEKFPIWCSKKSEENKLLKKHRSQILQESKDEYLRLLYVAMTRAENELYIAGYGDSKDKESWYEIVKNSLSEMMIEKIEVFQVKNIKNSSNLSQKFKEIKLENFNIVGSSHNLPASQINEGQIRGKLIHKILEIFGKNYREDKLWLQNLSRSLIEKEEFISQKEKQKILKETNDFLNSPLFEQIFSGEIKCEMDVAGEMNGKKISIRIDLIKITPDEITIIDYKSDETLPDIVPAQYLEQLFIYKSLLTKIFPEKKISCAILWVKFLELRTLSNF